MDWGLAVHSGKTPMSNNAPSLNLSNPTHTPCASPRSQSQEIRPQLRVQLGGCVGLKVKKV